MFGSAVSTSVSCPPPRPPSFCVFLLIMFAVSSSFLFLGECYILRRFFFSRVLNVCCFIICLGFVCLSVM